MDARDKFIASYKKDKDAVKAADKQDATIASGPEDQASTLGQAEAAAEVVAKGDAGQQDISTATGSADRPSIQSENAAAIAVNAAADAVMAAAAAKQAEKQVETQEIKQEKTQEAPSDSFPEQEKGTLDKALQYLPGSSFIKPQTQSPAPVEESSQKKSKQKKYVMIAVSAVLVIAIFVGLILFFNRGITMIDLQGWTENDAQLWARDNNVLLQVDKEYSDDVDAGKVISQESPAGSKVKKGSFIKILVSIGYDPDVTLPLPDFMSMSKEEIELWIKNNHMDKVRITTEFSNTVPVGKVIRFEINDETVVDEVRRNTPIYIIISKGLEDDDDLVVEVPNFSELSLADAYSFAREAGVTLTVKEQYDEYIPEGIIISQSVKAKEKIKKGDQIILTISKGKQIIVPNFAGYSKERAMAVAAELGIAVTIEEKYSNAQPESFISQSIAAGTEYEHGNIIELLYSIDNEIVLPDFVGQTGEAVANWAKELNKLGASIYINTSYTRHSTPKGTIIYQDKSNIVIGISATINITVSEGKLIYVPDFVAPASSDYAIAMTREKAMQICEELNIIPIFQEGVQEGRLPGEIFAQSIEIGSEITEGSTIVLYHTPVNYNVDVPSFIGLSKEEIVAAGYGQYFSFIFVVGDDYQEALVGKVYQQSHLAYTKVASGTTITLTLRPEDLFNFDPDGDGDEGIDEPIDLP